jgi:hypothetical protein
MVLLAGEQMESGLRLFGESLRAVITRGDFEVKATDFSALVLVLDAKVGDRNLAVHNFEVVFVCDPDALVGEVFVGIDPSELTVQLLLEFVVEDNATNLTARAVNFIGYLVVEPVEVCIVTGFLGLDEAVVNRLSFGNELRLGKKSMAGLRECQDPGRVGRVAFDAALFDEPLVAKILNIVLRPRAVASIT